MTSSFRAWVLSFVAGLVALGCARPSAHSTANASTSSASALAAWASLSHAERKTYMQAEVVPTMEPLFAAHDAQRFTGFGCRSCHGSQARERNYAMPNPELPTLYPTGSAEQRATVERHRDTARFMHQQVTPHMRKLLGVQSYDPGTGQGFSCFYCHPRGEPAALTEGGQP